MAENFRHGVPEDLSGWMLKRNRVMPTKKKRYFKLAAQVLSSHVKDVRSGPVCGLGEGGGMSVRRCDCEAAAKMRVRFGPGIGHGQDVLFGSGSGSAHGGV